MQKIIPPASRLLLSRHVSIRVAGIALLLCMPALWTGFISDDFTLRFLLEYPDFFGKAVGPQGPWDIFRFQGADRASFQHSFEAGLWPWWSAPDFQIAFFRPVASLHHAIDYSLWPDAAWFMHLENVLLFCALTYVVSRFYRELLGATPAAGLAAFFFAVAGTHAMPITWIANRSTLWGMLWVTLALWFHHRWRAQKQQFSFVVAISCFSLGLLSSEIAVGVGAYLLGYAIFIEQASWKKRAMSLSPYLCIGAGWALYYSLHAYGAVGGGFYIDPVHEPVSYLAALVVRLPILLVAEFLALPADFAGFIPRSQQVYLAAIFWILLFVLGNLIYRTLPNEKNSGNASSKNIVGFLFFGMLVSLFPVCATSPADRLLFCSEIGALAILAISIIAARKRASSLWRGFAMGLFLAHGVFSAVSLPLRIYIFPTTLGAMYQHGADTLPSSQQLKDKTLVIVNAPDSLEPTNALFIRSVQEKTLVKPKALRILTGEIQGNLHLKRIDEKAVELSVTEGLFQDLMSTLFRSDKTPFTAGETIRLPDVTLVIEAISAEQRPTRILAKFNTPLDDESHLWITWAEHGFVPFELPRVGETVQVPTTSLKRALGLD